MADEKDDIEDDDSDICSDIANLSSSLGNLSEIDASLLSKGRQAMLAKIKRQIFDSLVYYCECLPQLDGNEKKSED
jgi:hypothetical protein